MWYILDEHGDPVGPVDPGTWGRWRRSQQPMDGSDPTRWSLRVAWNRLDDGTVVSTVFLGLDHGIDRERPELYETMVFDSTGHSIDCYRDGNRHAALARHDQVVALYSDRLDNSTPMSD